MINPIRTFLILLFLCPTLAFSKTKLAVTVDDLPASGIDVKGFDRLGIVKDFVKSLKKHQVPGVYGFLNGVQAVHQQKRLEVLRYWKEAGHYLGNHTWSHQGLTKSSSKSYIDEIEKNETLLLDYSSSIKELKVFRYTYLEEGNTTEKRYALRSYLKKRNYQIAQVTIDSSDWYWLEAFARCVEKGDQEGQQDLKKSFIKHNLAALEYAKNLGNFVWGKEIPHIYLLHINAFTTFALDDLLNELSKKDVVFVDSKEHIFHNFFDEDTTFIGEHGKDYLQQAFETRKLSSENLVPPKKPFSVTKMCL